MNKEKLNTITNLFEGVEIRSIWDNEKEEYYFSIIDVIRALTGSERPRKYWNDLKIKLDKEGSQLSEKIGQLKMKSTDGKYYLTDTLDTQGILRLIQSVPSPKAEPFKLWLASLGSDRIDEVFDPEIAINRSINYYRNRGFDDAWIETRIKGIIKRKDLTDTWKQTGVREPYEYAILTNEIYKSWSGMTTKEYKEYKGLRKESLRDNMDDIELILTELGEKATKRLVQKKNPKGLKENIEIAKKGGNVAKVARTTLETDLEESVISKNNNLDYKYIKEEKLIKENNIKK